MNTIVVFLSLLSLLINTTQTSQNKPTFEGKVAYNRTILYKNGQTSEKIIHYWLKENQLRVDYFYNNTLIITRIVDANTKELKVLVNDNFEKKASIAKFNPLNLTNIGKITTQSDTASKTILGYKCQKINFSHGELKATIWVATELPFDHNTLAGAILNTSEGLLPQDLLGIPLETTITDAAKEQTITIKATNIQNSTIHKDIFEIPNDYKIKIVE